MKTKIGSVLEAKVKNKNNKIQIALLYGGTCSERSVSLMSFEGIKDALLNLGYKVFLVDVGDDFHEVIPKIKCDVVFNGLYGKGGEDGYIPHLLEKAGIKYTHSGVEASRIGFNKLATYEVCKSLGINIPNYKVIKKASSFIIDETPKPFVLKPFNEGSSVGVKIFFEGEDNSYDWADRDEVIMEDYIKGREINATVFGSKTIGALEVIPLKKRFYDFESKYTSGMCEYITPPVIDKQVQEKIFDAALKIHNALGCRVLSRSDFIIDENKNVYFLEINTHPGMTRLSNAPKTCKAAGIEFEEIIDKLVKAGLEIESVK